MKRCLILILLTFGLFQSCKSGYNYRSTTKPFYTPGQAGIVAVDSSIIAEISPYKIRLDSAMDEVLAISAEPLEKGQPESKLGNFVADLCLLEVNERNAKQSGEQADFCVLNNGGLRSSLPSGSITLGNVFELMPFENELVVLELNGSSTAKLLLYISQKGGVPVSNLKMKILEKLPTDIYINGNSFDSTKTYRVVTSDYLATGGDAMNMFTESIKSEATGLKVRDAIVEYLRLKKSKGETIKVETDGRISK